MLCLFLSPEVHKLHHRSVVPGAVKQMLLVEDAEKLKHRKLQPEMPRLHEINDWSFSKEK